MGEYEKAIHDSQKSCDLIMKLLTEVQTEEEQTLTSRTSELTFNLAVTHYNTAECYFNLGQYYPALHQCDSTLRLRPSFKEALCVRGATHNALGHHAAAIVDLDEALKGNYKYGIALRHRGIARCMLKRYHEATRDFERCLKLDQEDEASKKWLLTAKAELRKEEEEAER